jgi:hypothetical protein
LAAFLVLCGWQLFVPPLTGLSDNNDFAKVFGPAKVCEAPRENLNTYFVSGYRAGPECKWASGFTSTEIALVDLARFLSRPFTGRYYFDLRASAALHVAILAVAMALLLRVTRCQPPMVRYLLPPLAILMFSDVAFVAYLNSAYMDNASWVLLLLLAGIAVQAGTGDPGGWIAPAYAITGILLVFSKAQHAVLGIPFAALALFHGCKRTGSRAAWLVTAAVMLVSSLLMPQLTPDEYRNISLYNLVFYRLAPNHPNVLAELKLDAGYQKWVGTDAFRAGSPLPDPDWSRAFGSRVSFGDIAWLYLRKPAIALREIERDLHDSTYSIRPVYMANYRQADGFAPHTQATRFSLWSNLQGWMNGEYPHHLLVLYALPLLAVLAYQMGRLRLGSELLPLAVTLMCAGVLEFLICALADAIDTNRHLFLFQIISDLLILLLAAWVLRQMDRRACVTIT